MRCNFYYVSSQGAIAVSIFITAFGKRCKNFFKQNVRNLGQMVCCRCCNSENRQ